MKKTIAITVCLIFALIFGNYCLGGMLSDTPSKIKCCYDKNGNLIEVEATYEELKPYKYKSADEIRTSEEWQKGFCPYCLKEAECFVDRSCLSCHNLDRSLKYHDYNK